MEISEGLLEEMPFQLELQGCARTSRVEDGGQRIAEEGPRAKAQLCGWSTVVGASLPRCIWERGGGTASPAAESACFSCEGLDGKYLCLVGLAASAAAVGWQPVRECGCVPEGLRVPEVLTWLCILVSLREVAVEGGQIKA